MVSIVLGVLFEKGLISYEECRALSKELEAGVIPADFDLAMKRVKEAFASYERAEAKKKARKVVANAEPV